MKAILINPKEQTIKEVEYKGDFKEIYSLVDCNTFDCVYLDNVEVLYVDDEGLYVTDNRFFSINSRVLAGNGLLLGSDAEGETIGTGLTLQMVKDMVEWMPVEHVETPYMSFKSFVDWYDKAKKGRYVYHATVWWVLWWVFKIQRLSRNI